MELEYFVSGEFGERTRSVQVVAPSHGLRQDILSDPYLEMENEIDCLHLVFVRKDNTGLSAKTIIPGQ